MARFPSVGDQFGGFRITGTLALADAHAAGIVDRDLEPSNVLLRNVDASDVFAYLCDFGIAQDRSPGLTDPAPSPAPSPASHRSACAVSPRPPAPTSTRSAACSGPP